MSKCSPESIIDKNVFVSKSSGRMTLPVEVGVDQEMVEVINRWGADAVRNSDGTELPQCVKDLDLKVYATLSPVRYDQNWIKAHPHYYPQKYLITDPEISSVVI